MFNKLESEQSDSAIPQIKLNSIREISYQGENFFLAVGSDGNFYRKTDSDIVSFDRNPDDFSQTVTWAMEQGLVVGPTFDKNGYLVNSRQEIPIGPRGQIELYLHGRRTVYMELGNLLN